MLFTFLPAHHFAQLKIINDFNNYASVLVLLDDLLCKYDSVPRYPEYLPAEKNPELAGTPELLSEAIDKCDNELLSSDLQRNLQDNIATAFNLYRERDTKRAEISEFLAELIRQYLEVIHPAVYPESAR